MATNTVCFVSGKSVWIVFINDCRWNPTFCFKECVEVCSLICFYLNFSKVFVESRFIAFCRIS